MENVINFDNMFSFSSEDIFGFLQRTIDEEMQKGEKGMDAVLIEECVLILEQIFEKEIYSPTKVKIREKYRELREKHEKIKNDDAFWNELTGDNDALKSILNPTISKKPTKHIKFRRSFFIAAIVFTSLLGMTITGMAKGKNIFGDMKFFGIKYNDLSAGVELTDGKISVYKNDKDEYYSTIEEMISAQQYEGFYYPESFEYDLITINEYDDRVDIVFNNFDGESRFPLNVLSYDECGIYADIPAYEKNVLQNGTEVFCYMRDDGKYQLMFKMGNWYYCCNTENYDDGIKFIETFKEVIP